MSIATINKITFFIATYSTTGVPLAQMRLAKEFSKRGCKVDFIIGYVPDGLDVPSMEGVNSIIWARNRALKLIGPVIKYLYSVKPDVVFSAEDHLNLIVLFSAIVTGSNARISVSSRVTASVVYPDKLISKNYIIKKLLKIIQNRANALVCVSQDMADEYNALFKTNKYQCIYNVVADSEAKSKMHEEIDEKWFLANPKPLIISAGTLTHRKGFQDLILAMKELVKHVDARLVILGEGPMRVDLEKLIVRHNMSSVVTLVGHKDNPLKYFSKADVFVLSSYAEGLPNVLVEAIMCGCTPVSTDCPTGPREVLKDSQYGYLVPMNDPKSMASAIKCALENPIPMEEIEKLVFPFTVDQVIEKHRSALGF